MPKTSPSNTVALSYEEQLQRQVDKLNLIQGDLKGVDCTKCLNRGCYYILKENNITGVVCGCMQQRYSLLQIKKSGMGELLNKCTFENYIPKELWQERLKKSTMEFAENGYKDNWLCVVGQVGCGKTHLATAIIGELLNKGLNSRYMLWRDETVRLKAVITDDISYNKIMDELKTVSVLYIDDFFKTEKDKKPTTADINIAFEILNHRYCNKLSTIITSEKMIDELIDIDEAVGSRIFEKCKNYCLVVGYDKSKNYRLRGV